MSLYALLPGAPLSPKSTGTAANSVSLLYQPIRAANDFAKDMAKHFHEQQATTATKPRVVVDFSKIQLDTSSNSCSCLAKRQVSRTNSLSTADETLSSSVSSHAERTIRPDQQQLKIQVQNVRINFLKLTRPTSRSQETLRSVCRSKKDARLRRRKQQYTITNSFTCYENAVEFDLVLQNAGRNYTSKRTVHQIAQLRNDLLDEVAFLERLQRRRVWTDDSSWDSVTSTTTGINSVYIPPLPRMSEAGVFGGGFAQMSGLLQAFRPALEAWFTRLVAAVSEDSPILADFLWEPLTSELAAIPEESS
jgi:hypothetical protein